MSIRCGSWWRDRGCFATTAPSAAAPTSSREEGCPRRRWRGCWPRSRSCSALGVPAIAAHVEGYLDRLEPELAVRGFTSLRTSWREGRSGILSLEPPPGVTAASLARELRARGVACATPDGALRFSPHWSSDPGEIPGVLAAVDGALAVLGVPGPS